MSPSLLFIFLLILLFTTSSSSTLDPKQLTALQSMGLPLSTPNPCNSTTPHILTLCDSSSSSPFRHLTSLTLSNCSSSLFVSSTALHSLSSSLFSLSFLHCPHLSLPHLPPSFPLPLQSLSSLFSLSHLSAIWLSRLHNLTHLSLISTPITTSSGPVVFLSQMPHLLTAVISDCNLTGRIPHHWHSLNLTHLDLSSNHLTGSIPTSINVLGELQFLNLSSNSLFGPLPISIGELISLKNVSFSQNGLSGSVPDSIGELPELVHLDLSGNRFNGSVPGFLAEMEGLRYLNLEDNEFEGVLPFNGSFLKRLEVFRVGGNGNLCYNRSLISVKMKLGIAQCDKYGMPVTPPPDKSAKSDSGGYDDGGNVGGDDSGDDDDGGGKKSNGGGGHHGPNKLVLGVAIGLSCLVFLVIFLVCVSKVCG